MLGIENYVAIFAVWSRVYREMCGTQKCTNYIIAVYAIGKNS